jgi:hypothetical protein
LVALVLAACSLTELDDLSSNSGPNHVDAGSGGSGGTAGSSDLDASDVADVSLVDTGNDTADGPTAPCEEYCQALVGACTSQSYAACLQGCHADLDEWPRCNSEYATWVTCAAEQGVFNCTLNPPLDNCLTERTVFEDCTWYVKPLCTVPLVAPSGGSCYAGQACNPVTNDCPTGETCYLAGFEDPMCGSGTGTETVCEACNEETGPYCNGGLTCVGANGTQCARFCCTDADCGGEPGSCMTLGTLGLKFCGQTG